MEEIGALMHGFAVVLSPMNISLMFIGVILGVLIGVLYIAYLVIMFTYFGA